MDEAKEKPLPSTEDVPEARRESVVIVKSPESAPGSPWRWIAGGLGAIALLTITLPPIRQSLFPGRLQTFNSMTTPTAVAPPTSGVTPPGVESSATATASKFSAKKTLLGHRAYSEAPASELVSLTGDGRVKLRRSAAEKFEAMVAAAQSDGVSLVPLSGFRSQEEQSRLFFQVQEERGQSATQRAEVSAPPGYSEHHTGYALDVGDGDRPSTDVNPSFAETDTFRWLKKNAVRYGFEMSFPPNNPQGVSYEPWHWRFVGDRDSLETFYQDPASTGQ